MARYSVCARVKGTHKGENRNVSCMYRSAPVFPQRLLTNNEQILPFHLLLLPYHRGANSYESTPNTALNQAQRERYEQVKVRYQALSSILHIPEIHSESFVI